ncbi:MAG: hypothetical protein ACR2MM_01735 [Flavobacteriaceae bacterium]
MIKNYLLIFFKIVLIFGSLLMALPVLPQEPKIFTRSDFDLTGPVKTCRVITDYGKEDFEFNNEGLLTKSVTRYSQNDYDVSYYKYQEQRLVERRAERYQDGKFDEITSMAHFYSYDSLPQTKITERILSYNKDFQEQYEYFYNKAGQLITMRRSHAEGLDETQLDYSIYKDESTVSYMLNGLLQKSVRTSVKKQKNGEELKIELIKYFIEGVPEKATERTLNSKGLLVSELNFSYSKKEKSFVPLTKKVFSYDERDKLESVTSTFGKLIDTEEYLYQFDDNDGGNWVKKIISPENSYTTRVIEYYDPVRTPERP